MPILLFLLFFLLGNPARAQLQAENLFSAAEMSGVEAISGASVELAPMTDEATRWATKLLGQGHTTPLVLAFDSGSFGFRESIAAFHVGTTIQRVKEKGVLLRPKITARPTASAQRSYWVVLAPGPTAADDMAEALRREGHEIGVLKDMLKSAGIDISRLEKRQRKFFDGTEDSCLFVGATTLMHSHLHEQGLPLKLLLAHAVPDSMLRYSIPARRSAYNALKAGLSPYLQAAGLMAPLAPSDRADLQGARRLLEIGTSALDRLDPEWSVPVDER